MSRRTVVAVACVCLLAGCGQWTPLGSSTPEPLTTVSSDGLTGERQWLADGNVRPDVLAYTHGRTLGTTNYTMRVEQVIQRADGSRLRRSLTYREVGPGEYRGYVQYNTSVPALQEFGTVGYWHNGTHTATRFNTRLRPMREGIWRTDSPGPVSDLAYSDTLGRLLVASGANLDGSSDADPVVLSGTRTEPPRAFGVPEQLTAVGNVSGQFRVRPDGVVVDWRLTYEATFQGDRVRVRQTGQFRGIGNTVIERPPWVETASKLDT
ncbi:hypothetical protein [Halorientalis pallida]|uniref:Lipoprotein n=1 Tax=Halorientalis pallida TaxID=2479928 RepID=A0A498KUI9_9EURY|nr:hypothetical protein [Halorientalis pallida]RXK47914.1 hypothetical protein EAF64_14860 [Halorientalis pallida]